jgi:hypothetical protein
MTHIFMLKIFSKSFFCRSQWPRSLGHELSSPPQPLGLWIRVPLGAWISVCLYSVFMLSYVKIAALRRLIPLPRNPIDCLKDQENEKVAKAQQRAVEPEIDS